MYIYTYIHTYIHIYTYIYIYIHTHTHTITYLYQYSTGLPSVCLRPPWYCASQATLSRKVPHTVSYDTNMSSVRGSLLAVSLARLLVVSLAVLLVVGPDSLVTHERDSPLKRDSFM